MPLACLRHDPAPRSGDTPEPSSFIDGSLGWRKVIEAGGSGRVSLPVERETSLARAKGATYSAAFTPVPIWQVTPVPPRPQ